MIRARPLVPLAAGFIAGIAAARGREGLWILFLGLTLLGTASIIRWRHPLLLALLGFALGGACARRRPAAGNRNPSATGSRGSWTAPPKIYRSLEDPDSGPSADGSFTVGCVQVGFFRREIPLIGGERVAVRGPMHRPRHASNPGQFDYAAYIERRGLDAIMTMDDLHVLDGPPSGAGRGHGSVRSSTGAPGPRWAPS
jgi:hypothetical protein